MNDGKPLGADRARDHLANERTFLAWLRTALATLALGAVLLRVTNPKDPSTVAAGGVVLAGGVLVLLYGAVRYYAVAKALEADEFRSAGRSPAVVTVGVLLVLAVVVPLLLV